MVGKIILSVFAAFGLFVVMASVTQTVAKVQVAVLDPGRKVQHRLHQIAVQADTSTPAGIGNIVQGTEYCTCLRVLAVGTACSCLLHLCL